MYVLGEGWVGPSPPESRWWAKAGVGRICSEQEGRPPSLGVGGGGWRLGPKVRPPLEETLNRREKTGFGVSPPFHQEGCCCRAGAQGRSDGQRAG